MLSAAGGTDLVPSPSQCAFHISPSRQLGNYLGCIRDYINTYPLASSICPWQTKQNPKRNRNRKWIWIWKPNQSSLHFFFGCSANNRLLFLFLFLFVSIFYGQLVLSLFAKSLPQIQIQILAMRWRTICPWQCLWLMPLIKLWNYQGFTSPQFEFLVKSCCYLLCLHECLNVWAHLSAKC